MEKIISPEAIMDVAAGYQKSQTLFSLVELEIPDLLSKKKLKLEEIAENKKIHPLAMRRFLDVCVSLGLLKKLGEKYANTEIAENFLVKSNEFYLGGQLKRYQNRSLPQWTDLTEHLKNWDYGESNQENPEDADQGAEAMEEQHRLALLHGFALAENFDFSKYEKILDLGGGTGATSIALCKKFPNLRSIVLDLPENVGIAQKFIKKAKLTKRIETIGADFKKDDLPDDFDGVILANFMSVSDAEENRKLLKKIYKKLPKQGVCLLSGWIVDDSKFSPLISVLFCLEDICWNAPDVERSENVYKNWLKNAGFRKIECRTYLEPTKMMFGFK